MREIWKTVPNTGGMYEVSNQGNVRSWYGQGKILKPCDNGSGYKQVNLRKEDKSHFRPYIHRLVLELFLPTKKCNVEVNHKDGNKANNRLSNLEWVTRERNHQHRFQTLGHSGHMKGRNGYKHPKAKRYVVTFPDGHVEEICGLSKFCRDYGLDQPTMSRVIAGDQANHRGFTAHKAAG